MENIKVYKMDECTWIATRKGKDVIRKEYIEVLKLDEDEVYSLEEIEEVDYDNEYVRLEVIFLDETESSLPQAKTDLTEKELRNFKPVLYKHMLKLYEEELNRTHECNFIQVATTEF